MGPLRPQLSRVYWTFLSAPSDGNTKTFFVGTAFGIVRAKARVFCFIDFFAAGGAAWGSVSGWGGCVVSRRRGNSIDVGLGRRGAVAGRAECWTSLVEQATKFSYYWNLVGVLVAANTLRTWRNFQEEIILRNGECNFVCCCGGLHH